VILHPGILALIIGSLVVTAMMVYSSFLGLTILRKWDISSSSPAQLALERKTYLISTIMNSVLGFEIFSALLFVYTVEDMHRIFVGAMCATGTLNANPIGWYVLYTKIVIFFVSSIWIAFNYIDQRADDYPLVKKKYALLLVITPIVALDAYLQLKYFLGLKPNIITSCCGSLFSETGSGIASSLSALPVKPTMALFYGSITLFLLNLFAVLGLPNRTLRYLLPETAFLVFIASIAAIIAFISPYFYEIPTHHCPFDILQSGYYFIGFPLYITLFSGVFFGMMTGLLEPFKKLPSLHGTILKLQKKWAFLSIVLILIFTVIASWPIVFSSFTLEGYY
jgi:hypothetical protein